uniref:Uncharacterized protein n=1 Tax=Romanomermis culicivorax TaxID=13658 RepID=A0A915JP77_ROMCU
MLRSGSYPL